MLVRNAGRNCIVTEFKFFEIMEINVASDVMTHISGIASPVV